MDRFEFETTAFFDSPDTLAENCNKIAGKALMQMVRDGFVAAGYDCDTVSDEDWGWYFYASRNGRTYLCGGQTDQGPEGTEAAAQTTGSAFVTHERGLFDRLRGRNRPDPDDQSIDELRRILVSHPEIANPQPAD